MIKMTDLAASLATKHGLKTRESKQFVTEFVNVINEALRMEKQVKVKGLGTFKVTSVSARESVNVTTGERIIIESRDKISFTPDASMRDLVNRPFAQFDTVPLTENVDFTEIDERYRVTDEPKTEEPDTTGEDIVDKETDNKPAETEETPAQMEDTEEKQEEQETVKVEEEEIEHIEVVSQLSTPATAPQEEETRQHEEKDLEHSKACAAISSAVIEETNAHDNQLIEQIGALRNANKWLRLAVAALIVIGVAGFFYMKGLVTEEKMRVDELIALNNDKQDNASDTISSEDKEQLLAQNGTNGDIYEIEPTPETEVKTEPAKPVEKPVKEVNTPPVSKQEPAKTTDKPATKPAEKKVPKVTEGKYDFDPRVKYGAYEIVGVLKEVKVEKGQTVYSISRKHLGPGLECYVEALNGGTNNIREGQMLKIPILELKSKHKK